MLRCTRLLVCVVLACALSSTAAHAAPESRQGFGLGVVLGKPLGLSAKAWLGDNSALQFHLAWDFDQSAIGLYGDYLFHADVFDVDDFDLPLYFGGGLAWLTRNPGKRSTSNNEASTVFVLRVPLGIALLMHSLPLEFFAEVVPGIRLIPVTRFHLDGALGARYYF